ncbi:MAG: hypothetical protein Q8N51_11125 [Gammaproteobacteria bacterium]|nr:hypothetical protein [Gammaproteobacteria bacterium]
MDVGDGRQPDQERKLITSQGLGLAPEQAAASYDNPDDATANQLLSDMLKFQEKSAKVRSKYLRKFKPAVGPVMVARFYQIENKLDAGTGVGAGGSIAVLLWTR